MSEVITFDVRDEYKRRPVAENLIRLLTSDVRVSPMVIDGSWGTGKTEFCKKMVALLNDQEKSIPVYVDAFRADHADQPLMTLLAAILSLLPKKEKMALMKKAMPALRFGVKTAGKAAVGWLLKQDAVELEDEWKDALKNAGEAIVDKTTESLLKEHMNIEQSIFSLQESLSGIAKEKPIIFFIDELDRCRPDFALGMLEVIKHILDVDGVQFVLVTNTQQLKASINHSYGGEIDAQRYLDKFLAFSFRLPSVYKENNGYNLRLASEKHFLDLIGNSSVLKTSGLINEAITKFLFELIKIKQLSLREVEALARYYEIYQVLTEGKGLGERGAPLKYGYLLLRIYAVYCACILPKLAGDLLENNFLPTEIAKSIGRTALEEPDSKWSYGSNLLTGLLLIDLANTPNSFLPNDESRRNWDQMIANAFNGWPPSYEEKYTIVREALRSVALDTN
ncbi:KAP family P-loop NTPase fold protein [Chitinimonas sp.]|uniref:KAP family P-loop NTPase fold protein n=1 Tax=Chitinimonas sp. TaxID=1934313 RepID=UPI002F94EC66